jgi:Flp pilus assembly pilin Flp
MGTRTASRAVLRRHRALRRLFQDTRGQDLLEYALLSALFGVVALLTMNALGVSIGNAYKSANTAVNELWEYKK